MKMRRFQPVTYAKPLARWIQASWAIFALMVLVPAPLADSDVRRDPAVAAIERAMPCVVNIATESVVEVRDPFADLFRDFWSPYHRQQVRKDLGSGVIIDEEGYILTNLHVVQRARRVQVKLSEEAGAKEYEVESFIGTAQTDVALLKIVPPRGEKLPKFQAIKLAKDDDLLLGETVLSMGNPFGLGGSVSRGILSSKRRATPKENEELNISNWLQTDAAINPGNSGGPLINLRGEMIGINVAILPGAQGIGFAIPIKEVREALAQIFTPETSVPRWSFGAQVLPGTNPLLIHRVEKDTPAEKAGLRVGDAVLEVNGKAPRSFIEFNRWLREPSQRTFQFTVQRRGERRQFEARLISFAELEREQAARLRQRLGADLQPLSNELANQYGLEPGMGLLVAGVEKGGPAEAAQLKRHYVITAMDRIETSTLPEAMKILSDKTKGEKLEISVLVPQIQGSLILGYRRGITEIKLR